MRIDIDLDTSTWLSKSGLKTALSRIEFKHDTSSALVVRFWQAGVQTALTGTLITGKFGIKPTGQYDAVPLVLAAAWTFNESVLDPAYTFEPDFATEALAAALLSGDADPENDVESITAIAEVRWDIDGQRSRTQTVPCLIYNDVLKDLDSTPTPAPEIIGTTAPVNTTATLTLDPAGANNAILLTADAPGAAGNAFTAAIIIDAAAARYPLSLSTLTITSGDKHRLIIAGAVTADVNGPLSYIGQYAGVNLEDHWTSNGLDYDANFGVSAFTHLIHDPGVGTTITRYDAAGTVVYASAAITGETHPDTPVFAAPSTGSGTPTLTATAATAAQAVALINAAAMGVTAANAPANDGTGTLAAVAAAPLTGGLITAAPPYIRVHGGFLYIQESGIWKKAALSAL